jgi:methyl-accepting chemotaxis protein
MDTATQQNAAMVEETMAACQNLHNQASFLSDSVSRFNLGKRRPAAAAAIQKVRRPAVASAAARLETEPAAGEWAEF